MVRQGVEGRRGCIVALVVFQLGELNVGNNLGKGRLLVGHWRRDCMDIVQVS